MKRDAAVVPIGKAPAYDKDQIGKSANPNVIVPNPPPYVTPAPIRLNEVKREADPQTDGPHTSTSVPPVPIGNIPAYDMDQIAKLANGPNWVVPNDLPEITVVPVPSREVKREAEPQATDIGKREAQRFKGTFTTGLGAREAEPTLQPTNNPVLIGGEGAIEERQAAPTQAHTSTLAKRQDDPNGAHTILFGEVHHNPPIHERRAEPTQAHTSFLAERDVEERQPAPTQAHTAMFIGNGEPLPGNWQRDVEERQAAPTQAHTSFVGKRATSGFVTSIRS